MNVIIILYNIMTNEREWKTTLVSKRKTTETERNRTGNNRKGGGTVWKCGHYSREIHGTFTSLNIFFYPNTHVGRPDRCATESPKAVLDSNYNVKEDGGENIYTTNDERYFYLWKDIIILMITLPSEFGSQSPGLEESAILIDAESPYWFGLWIYIL